VVTRERELKLSQSTSTESSSKFTQRLEFQRDQCNIMNSFIADIFEKIALEASKLVRYNKKHTLSSREVQTAVRLLLQESSPSMPSQKAPRPSPSTAALEQLNCGHSDKYIVN